MKFKKIVLTQEQLAEMKKQKLSLAQYLETLDPATEYPDTKLDAFERQLAAHGIVLRGPNSTSLAVVYDPENRYLFPEIIDRTVRTALQVGMNKLSLADIVSVETGIDSGVIAGLSFDMDDLASSDVKQKRVTEKGKFPVVSISLSSKVVKLRKYGRAIEITDEAKRRISLNYLALMIQAIVTQWMQDMISDAVDALQTGLVDIDTAAASTITYEDMVDLSLEFDNYDMTVVIANKVGCGQLLKDDKISNPLLSDVVKTGVWPPVLGAKLRRCNLSQLTDKVLAVDNNFGLEQITENGSYLQEQDRWINGQITEIVISKVMGFSKLFTGAVKQLNYDNSQRS
jgi:hypothetical protein